MLRGSQAALVMLERVQRAMNEQVGRDPTSEASKRFVADTWEQTVQRYAATHGLDDATVARLREAHGPIDLPTPYESDIWYRIVIAVAAKVEATIERYGIHLGSAPVLGTVPSGDCNAITIRVGDTDEHLVLFEGGLFNFANLVSKAVAASVPSTREDGRQSYQMGLEAIERQLAADPEPIDRLGDVLAAYLIAGDPGVASPYLPDPEWETLARYLTTGIETFMLAHEYGHIIEGHLTAPAASRPLSMTAEEKIVFGWHREIEADVRGIQLAVQTMYDDGCDLALAYVGVDLTFGAFELIERGLSVLQTGGAEPSPGTASHPPAAARRANADAALGGLLGSAEAENPLALAAQMRVLLDHLWACVEPAFVRLHEQGVQPDLMWRQA